VLSFYSYPVILNLVSRQPEQPWYLHALVKGILYYTMFSGRYLSLPRWKERTLITLPLSQALQKTGPGPVRMYPTRCVSCLISQMSRDLNSRLPQVASETLV
jgi:hypothetical protein